MFKWLCIIKKNSILNFEHYFSNVFFYFLALEPLHTILSQSSLLVIQFFHLVPDYSA